MARLPHLIPLSVAAECAHNPEVQEDGGQKAFCSAAEPKALPSPYAVDKGPAHWIRPIGVLSKAPVQFSALRNSFLRGF